MVLLGYIAKIVLNIIYFFIKLFPTQNKVTFISRESNTITQDFKLLKDELEKDKNVKVVVLCKMLDGGIVTKIKYALHMIVQMYHIATSKVVVLDTYCICISILKHKKSLKVIQMWHALGSLKKFGYSILDSNEGRKSELSKVMGMHKNYDYVFTSSEYCKKYFAEAFNVSLDKMEIYPLPKLDLVRDKKNIDETKKKILKKYKNINEKEVILYAPTFRRGSGIDVSKIQELIDNIDYKKYNLIIKLHPIDRSKISDDRVIMDDNFSTIEFATISDYVITDYSAVMYEIAYLEKPLFFYAYDLDSYLDTRNFYIDYKKEMPGIISTNAKDIIKSIENKNYKLKEIKEFKNKFIKEAKEGYTKDIVNFIKKVGDFK